MKKPIIRESGYNWDADGNQYFWYRDTRPTFWQRLRRKWRHLINSAIEYMYTVQHGFTDEQLAAYKALGIKPWERVIELGGAQPSEKEKDRRGGHPERSIGNTSILL